MLAGVSVRPTAAAPAPVSEPAKPGLTVAVRNPEGLSMPGLSSALALATSIYSEAGVAVRWGIEGVPKESPTLTLVIVNSTTAPVGLSAEAMGVAPSSDRGRRGTIAYVFHDRVTAFAESHHLPLWAVLGCAMAHELGHLLLPVSAHAPAGIMRAQWHPSLFPPTAAGVPGFSPDQSRLLRARVASRE